MCPQCIVRHLPIVYECCSRQSPKIDPLTADISLFNMADAAAAAKLHVQTSLLAKLQGLFCVIIINSLEAEVNIIRQTTISDVCRSGDVE